MKTRIGILIILILVTTLEVVNAGDYRPYHPYEVQSIWKGYRGEAYYNYWYNPERPAVVNRGIVSGQELKAPMGDYPVRGFFGGYSVDKDGRVTTWSYTTGD